MPVHLMQMNEDPMIWQALKSRDFVVAKSEILLPRFFIKEMLEQDIKVVKHHRCTCMVRLSRDKAVVQGNYNDNNNSNNNVNKILFS